MSRVFSAMTGTGSARPIAVDIPRNDPSDEADETFVVEADDSPFVEIGGPTGTVFSAAPAKLVPEVKAKPEAAVPRSFPRIAAPAPTPVPSPDAPYLSVHFHDVSPRAPGRPATGPDPGLV